MKRDIPGVTLYKEVTDIFEVYSPHFPKGKITIGVYFDGKWYTVFSNMYIVNKQGFPVDSNSFSMKKSEAIKKVLLGILRGVEKVQSSQDYHIEWYNSTFFL